MQQLFSVATHGIFITMKALKIWLTKNGISQGELARRMNSDRHQVSRWVNAAQKPSLETLKKISKVTGLSMDVLLE